MSIGLEPSVCRPPCTPSVASSPASSSVVMHLARLDRLLERRLPPSVPFDCTSPLPPTQTHHQFVRPPVPPARTGHDQTLGAAAPGAPRYASPLPAGGIPPSAVRRAERFVLGFVALRGFCSFWLFQVINRSVFPSCWWVGVIGSGLLAERRRRSRSEERDTGIYVPARGQGRGAQETRPVQQLRRPPLGLVSHPSSTSCWPPASRTLGSRAPPPYSGQRLPFRSEQAQGHDSGACTGTTMVSIYAYMFLIFP
jgi:hypothetical protein